MQSTTKPIKTLEDQKLEDSSDEVKKEASEDDSGTESKAREPIGTSHSNSYFRVEIGKVTFDKRKGEIIGYPFVSFNSGQHDLAEFIVDDDFDAIREQIDEEDEVSIYIGFGKEYETKVMTGKISKYGRHYPNGTVITVMDFSSESQDGTTKVVDSKTGEEEEDEEEDSTEEQSDEKTTQKNVSELNKGKAKRKDLTESAVTSKNDNDLTYNNKSKIVTDKAGEAIVDESNTEAATREAKLVGDEVVSEGKELTRVSPGEGDESGIILDYIANRSVFIGVPRVTKRTDNQPKGGGGSFTVTGWNTDRKEKVGATVVVPSKLKYDKDKEVEILKKTVRLGDPIFSESMYLWGDATLGGKRIPKNERIVNRIISIAKVVDKMTREKTPNKKWQIISWYNNSSDNETIHTLGSAVDVYYKGIDKLFKELEPDWPGGLAYHPGSLMHIDNRHEDDQPKLRWTY